MENFDNFNTGDLKQSNIVYAVVSFWRKKKDEKRNWYPIFSCFYILFIEEVYFFIGQEMGRGCKWAIVVSRDKLLENVEVCLKH